MVDYLVKPELLAGSEGVEVAIVALALEHGLPKSQLIFGQPRGT